MRYEIIAVKDETVSVNLDEIVTINSDEIITFN